MTDFIETIEYDVPRYRKLKDHFIANAKISEDGKTITVGNQMAKKAGFLTWAFATRVFDARPAWAYEVSDKVVPADYTGRGLLQNVFSLTQGEMVDLMASCEAKRHITHEEKTEALYEELKRRAYAIEAEYHGGHGP